jgi:hypothetical protein
MPQLGIKPQSTDQPRLNVVTRELRWSRRCRTYEFSWKFTYPAVKGGRSTLSEMKLKAASGGTLFTVGTS